MHLAEDLLAQARHLAELDPGRPKQANLRRAASSAYYALFHLLVADAVQRMVPKRPKTLMNRVSRALSHGDMKQVCVLFRANVTSPKLTTLLEAPVSENLLSVAKSFVELQEVRHAADYDPGLRMSRAESLDHVLNAETASDTWRVVCKDEEANAFLAALAFGARWDR